jgi:hypothetical protein
LYRFVTLFEQAIYLDDQMSGWTIVNNTFIDCQKGVFVGGGRKTHVANNYFHNVDTALHLDDRGLGWQSSSCKPSGDDYINAKAFAQLPSWASYNITLDHYCTPVYNVFQDNTCCDCQAVSDFTEAQAALWLSAYRNNTEVCNTTRGGY